MKILFVSDCYPDEAAPQYCVFLEQQAKALIELGHMVDVLVPKTGPAASMAETEFHGIRVFRGSVPVGKLGKLLAAAPRNNPLRDFPWKNYNAVSLHFLSAAVAQTVLRNCKRAGVPIVQHFHGLNVWRDLHYPTSLKHQLLWVYNYAMKRLRLRQYAAIVGVSDKVCSVVRQHMKTKALFTVYNGVDSEKFTPGEKTNDVFTVLCVANLIPIKGHDYLLDAIAQLKQDDRQLRLQLIGVGPERDRLQERCRDLGIEQNVAFLGAQSYDAVAGYMRRADLFVMPSYFEALGCVYLESMCSGTLTCGCRGTGADEIIEDQISGLLVEQKSVDSICSAIAFAMDEPEKAQEIANNGMSRAKLFSWNASAKALENVYQTIIH